MWRRRFALGAVAAWAGVSLARLTRLVEPSTPPPGEEGAPVFGFFKAQVPADAGYLFVLPGEFGADTDLGPRLRYELYPRVYDDVRASQDEAFVRTLMSSERLRFIVVPDATQYSPGHWLRSTPAWLRRIDFDANRYVLEVVP